MRTGIELEKSNHYSPLPQALSDDDDDEDELKNSIHSRKVFNEKINFNALNEEVMKNGMSTPLIAASMHEPKKMSLSRTICFSLSVLLSCIAVMSFLWILPCDVGLAACKSNKNCDGNSDWQIQIPSTAFSSGLQLVDADQDGRMDIIVGFHPVSSNGSFTDTSPSFSAGLIVIRGFDGQKIWRQTYYSTPSDILCNVLDVNQDGVLDCILIGNRGLFSAINISNDYTFWYLHDHMSGRRPVNMSLPAIVPDLTDDEIEDLIVSCHLTEVTKMDEKLISPLAYLIIISGGMGELWRNPVQLRGCVLASKPVTVTINKIIYILVHCEPDSGPGSVLMLSLNELKEDALDDCSDFNSDSDETVCSNRTETEIIHSFQGRGSHLHLIVDDINGDDNDDIVMIGGDGEVAAYSTLNFSLLWEYQRANYDIISWVFGPSYEEKSKTLLLTYLPQDCSDDCSTVIVGLSGKNGSEIWYYSNKSVTSPVVLPKSKGWQNLVAFKAYSKPLPKEVHELQNISLPVKYRKSEELPFESTKYLGNIDDSTALIAVEEQLLFLNANYEIEAQLMEQVTTVCFTSNKLLPECLPEFAARASCAIGDFDGDEMADLVSITTSIEVASEQDIWNLRVTKTSLPRHMFEDTSSVQKIEISHLHSFE